MLRAWERNAFWVLLGKLEERERPERVGVCGKLMLKCSSEEREVKGVDWIRPVREKDNTVMNFRSK
jgi:hypothetical protein